MSGSTPFPFIGEVASLGAALVWAGSMSLYGNYGRGLSATALNLYKNSVALVFTLAVIILVRPPWPSDPWAIPMLLASGVIGLAVSDTALFMALERLGAHKAAAIQCLAPPIAALLALIFLGEALTPFELIGMSVTTVAVAGVIYFGGSYADREPSERKSVMAGLGFAVFAAFTQAIGVVIARRGFVATNVLVGTLARMLPAVGLLMLGQCLQWQRAGRSLRQGFGWRDRKQATAIFTAAFTGSFLGLLLYSAGTKYAKAGVASALSATYPVWIIPLTAYFFRERTSWLSVSCTVLAVVGVCLMLVAI